MKPTAKTKRRFQTRNRFRGAILAVVAALAASPVILAQTAPPSQAAAKATPDLSGFWHRPGFHPELTNPDGSPLIPPMQPWAAELYNARRRARDDNGKLAIDPLIGCLPPGIPRSYLARSTFDLYQVPGRVIQIFESNTVGRVIYTDGRGHPEGAPPMFMGHSIGRWDGDTLVVETVGLRGNDETWLDRVGHPHTEALRVVERIRRVKPDTLEVDLSWWTTPRPIPSPGEER